MAEYPREIPVVELLPGLTVWSFDGKKFIRDVYLVDYLYDLTETVPRFDQFTTDTNQLVTWRPAGKVFVTDGRDNRKVISHISPKIIREWAEQERSDNGT